MVLRDPMRLRGPGLPSVLALAALFLVLTAGPALGAPPALPDLPYSDEGTQTVNIDQHSLDYLAAAIAQDLEGQSVTATITAMPALDLSSSVSVEGTLPVTLSGLSALSPTENELLLVLLGGCLGLAAAAGISRVWGYRHD